MKDRHSNMQNQEIPEVMISYLGTYLLKKLCYCKITLSILHRLYISYYRLYYYIS